MTRRVKKDTAGAAGQKDPKGRYESKKTRKGVTGQKRPEERARVSVVARQPFRERFGVREGTVLKSRSVGKIYSHRRRTRYNTPRTFFNVSLPAGAFSSKKRQTNCQWGIKESSYIWQVVKHSTRHTSARCTHPHAALCSTWAATIFSK